MGTADHGHLVAGDRIGIANVDGLRDTPVRNLDRARVAGERTESRALRLDAQTLACRSLMHDGKQVEIGALAFREEIGPLGRDLLQIVDNQSNGIDGT